MPDAEGAVERLYEDPDVRDELRDDEATLMLKWAEAQLVKLAEQSSDDDDFDTRARQFRGLLKGMNRLVGSRATLDEASLTQRLSELAAQAASVATPTQLSAQAAAPSIPADQLGDLAGKLPSLDDAGAVNALTALFTSGVAPTPAIVPASVSNPRVSPMIMPSASPEPAPAQDAQTDADAMLYFPSLSHSPEEPHADDPT